MLLKEFGSPYLFAKEWNKVEKAYTEITDSKVLIQCLHNKGLVADYKVQRNNL